VWVKDGLRIRMAMSAESAIPGSGYVPGVLLVLLLSAGFGRRFF
jgi:hypothetical protein